MLNDKAIIKGVLICILYLVFISFLDLTISKNKFPDLDFWFSSILVSLIVWSILITSDYIFNKNNTFRMEAVIILSVILICSFLSILMGIAAQFGIH